MTTLTLVENGRQWGGLYLDGELLEQHRTCDRPETVATLCIQKDVDKFEKRGIVHNGDGRPSRFPDTLEKIRQSKNWKLR
jgi:hypothetical protein